MKTISVMRVQVVKDRSVEYEPITAPEQFVPIAVGLLQNAMERENEEFWVIYLDGRNRPRGSIMVSAGTLNQSLVHPREAFRGAIVAGAAAIIVCHNHPSGDPTPSREDLSITSRLRQVGELVGIKVLDHIIIGDEGKYISLAGQGVL
jgi:DNA repair protein RadC